MKCAVVMGSAAMVHFIMVVSGIEKLIEGLA
jgi:hypothetical protein